MKHNALIFDYICRASSELNHIFSVPVLILLTTKFVSVVTAAFIYIYYLIHNNSVLENYSLLYPFVFFTEWIQMLILLTSADMPVNQVVILNTPHHFESYYNKFSIRIVVDYTLLFRIFYVRWLRERLSRMTYLTFSRTSA